MAQPSVVPRRFARKSNDHINVPEMSANVRMAFMIWYSQQDLKMSLVGRRLQGFSHERRTACLTNRTYPAGTQAAVHWSRQDRSTAKNTCLCTLSTHVPQQVVATAAGGRRSRSCFYVSIRSARSASRKAGT